MLGSNSNTGVAGLTLGGGFGYLSRRFGLAVDNLEDVEIVTADGQVQRAAADDNGDLFWAVRGGGGNFGVVTQFRCRLHPVGPEISAGLMLWNCQRAEELVALDRDLTKAAPRAWPCSSSGSYRPCRPFLSTQARRPSGSGSAGAHRSSFPGSRTRRSPQSARPGGDVGMFGVANAERSDRSSSRSPAGRNSARRCVRRHVRKRPADVRAFQ